MSHVLACLLAVTVGTLSPVAAFSRQGIVSGQRSPAPAGRMQTPTRDGTPEKPGSARIRGRVVAADTGQPLRRAQVRVASTGTQESRITSTNAEGTYEFQALPAGRYSVTVTKGSFVSLSYGQLRSFDAGKPLELADGQIIEKVDFALPRGAVISGHVVDESGEPIADVRVTPMRYQYVQGRRQLVAAGRQVTTNDIGEYRIFGLAPGQYVLSATVPASGAIVIDSGSDERSGYAPTYYPGTADASQAQRVPLAIGQVASEVNIPLVSTRLSRVSGTASDAQGVPLSGGLVVVMHRSGTMIVGTSGTQVKPDGSFTADNLAPGTYLLQAVIPGAGGDRSEMASAQVSVFGEDVTRVQLMGKRAATGKGRVIIEPALATSVPPSRLRLMIAPARPEDDTVAAIGNAATVNDDYTFELKARPGLGLLLADVPPGWALKSVRRDGTDVTDTGIEFRSDEEISGIEVELTNKPTDVSGTVTNHRSDPVKDYSVIVFSTNPDRWGYSSRFIQTGRPDQDGRYKVKALPAGEYYAIALEYLERGESGDPEFLSRIKAGAIQFTLHDGETKALDLKISPSSQPWPF